MKLTLESTPFALSILDRGECLFVFFPNVSALFYICVNFVVCARETITILYIHVNDITIAMAIE